MMQRGNYPPIHTNCACCDDPGVLRAAAASRRRFLKAGAALLAGSAAAPMLPATALAQGSATDPDVARLQSARRILLKGGVILSLDRQVGDFANADVLIEDGRIREIRPNIAAADAVAVDAAHHVLIPGFIDTHNHSYQGLLRGVLANGLLNPD